MRFFFALFFVASVQYATAQHLDTIKSRFSHYRAEALQEKVYLHTDNDFYVCGESIWLKPYLVDGTLHKPVDFSKVIYVELLDRNNAVVLQAKIPARSNEGETALYIPATLETGSYTLRAYTSWMKNFSVDFYFHKPITIVNTFRKLTPANNKNSAVDFDIQLFPEGGHLVEGVNSKVAFKITDKFGKGLSYTGWLLSEKDTIAYLKPLRFGIGHFFFTPKGGKSYVVHVADTSGNKKNFRIPDIQPYGYTLQLNDSSKKDLQITVTASGTSAAHTVVYLFIHARNIVSKAEARNIQNGKAIFTLSKDQLPEGISHLTVFDAELRPVCERLYFQPVTKGMEIIITNDTSFNVREKVDVQISTSVGKERPSDSDLSISVYQVDGLSGSNSFGIHEYIWLTSDLDGSVESPEFYFSDHADVKAATDNLMLTHGWRRFKWDQVLSKESLTQKFLPEFYGHLISGKVTARSDTTTGGVLTYLSSPDKIIRLYGSRSNALGEVQFQTHNLYGSRKLIIQTENPDLYSFTINNPFSTSFAKNSFQDVNLTRNYEKVIRSKSIAMQVQHLYREIENSYIPNLTLDSIPFYGKPDDSYLLDSYTRFPVMEEVMREYVSKVRVRKWNGEFHFLVKDMIHETMFENDPLVLLDGVPVSTEQIMKFDPVKVKRLDVVARKYFLGAVIAPGIVSYSTYNGDLGGFELDPRTFSINYEGLQQLREFYAPSYTSEKEKSSRIPDYRKLLFWSGHLKKKADGNYLSSFFTSDMQGKFAIVVQGLSKDGHTGRSVSYFIVKEK